MFFQQKRLLHSKILRETTAFSEEQKIKYAAGLEEAYMSSDHTASENSSQDEHSGEESDLGESAAKPTVLAVKELPWRTSELKKLMRSLDRKVC